MNGWKLLGWVAGIGVAAAIVSEVSGAGRRKGSFDHALHRRLLRQLTRAAQLMRVSSVPPLVARHKGVANAAADDRVVYYNSKWVREQLASLCDDRDCQDALLLGLMAHELAHEEHDHASNDLQHPHEEELVADDWAGTALGLAGVSPEHFERLILRFGGACSPTHPAGAARVQQVRAAYARAMRSKPRARDGFEPG